MIVLGTKGMARRLSKSVARELLRDDALRAELLKQVSEAHERVVLSVAGVLVSRTLSAAEETHEQPAEEAAHDGGDEEAEHVLR